MMMKKLLIFLFSFIYLSALANNKERICIDSLNKPLAEKEAIVVLVGFGSKIQGTKKIADYFFHKGYDVYIPDYIARRSIANSVDQLDKFMLKHQLKKYKKLHVFSYIVGAWTLNNWIAQHPTNNIASILYDRSPLQERAPYALVKDIPFLIHLAAGKIMKEFSETNYPPISSEKISIGILIESHATKLMIKHKATALAMGPIQWDVKSLNQSYNDYFYTWINHDEMYNRFDVIGSEIFYFIKNQKFSPSAKREAYSDNPFVKFNPKP